MNALRIGELFAGYGGLGMGVQAAIGGELAWVSDVCKFDKDGNAGHYDPHRGPCRILAHRFPDVPNIGDVTKVDWAQVEPVDVLTGGSPCQDLSHAGKRQGMIEGTRSNLWVSMREAIATLRPSLVVWENVRGAYSAEADSELVTRPGLLDGVRRRDGQPVLRALGRVLGDLSDLGYVGGWHGIRAADVGAPHGRFRVFVVAYPASDTGRIAHRDGTAAALTERGGRGWGSLQLGGAPVDLAGDGSGPTAPDAADLGHERTRRARDGRTGPADGSLLPRLACPYCGAPRNANADCDGCVSGPLLPTPRATDGTKGGPNQRGSSGDLMLPSAVALLPTPAVNDMGEGKTPDAWDEWTAKMQAAHGNGNGHGKSLAIKAQRLSEPYPERLTAEQMGALDLAVAEEMRLLPTPRTANNENRQSERYAGEDGNFYGLLHNPERWGDYAAAIARWETVLGRPAPAPTMTSSKGNPQLSPRFVEWLMGLPDGWVTDVPGITRNEELKALGNGVVAQQCAAAVRYLLNVMEVAA